MKKIASILPMLCFTICFSFAQTNTKESQVNWISLEKAQELQSKSPKPIFIMTYPVWNGAGKKMDKTVINDSIIAKQLNKDFYAVKINPEGKEKLTFKGKEMSEARFAGYMRVRGYPSIILLNNNLEKVSLEMGYKTREELIDYLKTFNK